MTDEAKSPFRPIIGIENRTPQEVFDIMSDRIRALLAGPPEQKGWVMVPREPTREMANAFFDCHARAPTVFADPAALWTAMLSALPPEGEG